MNYQIFIKSSAEKEFERLSSNMTERITKVILSIEDNPYPHGSQKLRGVNLYRLRVGDYRILCPVEDERKIVEIFSIAHRRDVYR